MESTLAGPVSADELDWASDLCDQLGELFCLTFIKGVSDTGALLAMGAYQDTIGPRTLDAMRGERADFDAGLPHVAGAVQFDAWTLVVEPGGVDGADRTLLEAVSRGTEAVTVLRNEHAHSRFAYAVDGALVSAFEPPVPGADSGTQPDRLRRLKRATGLSPVTDPATGDTTDPWLDAEHDPWEDAVDRSMVLARRIVGAWDPSVLDGTLRSAHIEPWFVSASSHAHLYEGDLDPALAEAVDRADPHTQRVAAVEEVRRLAALAGLDGTAGLDEILEAAVQEVPATVCIDSPLGRRVRGWLRQARRAASGRRLLSPADRAHGLLLGRFTEALRGALNADARTAARIALSMQRPLRP